MALQPVSWSGLSALRADEKIPMSEAILVQDCQVDDGTVKGRNGYRKNTADAMDGSFTVLGGVFATDLFAGTAGSDLAAHTPNVGGTWTNLVSAGTGAILLDGVGGVYTNPFGSIQNPVYALSVTPSSPDYYVRAIPHYYSGNFNATICARIVDVSNYWYVLVSINQIGLGRVIGGIDQGGQNYTYDITALGNNDPIIDFYNVGNEHYLYVNGVQRAHVTSSDLPLAGKVGVAAWDNTESASNGMHLAGFQAYTTSTTYTITDDPQHLGRHRPNASSARDVVVSGGAIFQVTDASAETASDGAASLLSVPFGASDKVSGTQLGKYYYLANDQSSPTWRRIKSDFSIETLIALAKGVKPTTTFSSLSFSKFTSLAAPTLTGGAGYAALDTDYHEVFASGSAGATVCPIGGTIDYNLGSDQDWTAVNWLAIVCAVPTNSKGGHGGHVSISLGTSGGTYEALGDMYDPPIGGGGSPNYIYLNLNALSPATRAAVRHIRFTLTTAGDFWATHGYMPIPSAPGIGPQEYRVTFYNSTTKAESDPTDDLEVVFKYDDVVIPTYHSVFGDAATFIDAGNASLDPTSINAARCFNVGAGLAVPSRYEFAPVATFSGTIPTGSLYPNADTVRLWRLTDTGWRIVKTVTLSSAGTTSYTIRDDVGGKASANAKWEASGPPPQVNAMCGYAGRLVTGYQNRISISSFVPFGQDTDPYPKFPKIAVRSSDGFAFDIAPSNREQIQTITEGDACYIGTNERMTFMSDVEPGAVPFEICRKGVVGRQASIWIDDKLIWASPGGIYVAQRAEWDELSKDIKRYYRDTFAPNSRTCLFYRNRKLIAVTDTRYIRYDFLTATWSHGTLSHNIRFATLFANETVDNPEQTHFLTSDVKLARWQETATSDMMVGTAAGTVIPQWQYSTGYLLNPNNLGVETMFLDTSGGIRATVYNSSDTSRYRSVDFEPGDSEKAVSADFLNYKTRLHFKGDNTTALRTCMWGAEILDGVGT